MAADTYPRNAVIFDLDGTLLNSVADLAAADNYALRKAGLKERPVAQVRAFVGSGIRNLMIKSVYGQVFASRYADAADIMSVSQADLPEVQNAGTGQEQFEEIFRDFKSYYDTHMMVLTEPYDGIMEMLGILRERKTAVGVVSNKYDEAVKKLCSHYFPDLYEAAAGARDGMPRKPSPEPVLEVMDKLGTDSSHAVYVGDSAVDLETAENAGLPCIACSWGFRGRQALEQAGATVIADEPSDILIQLEKAGII